MSMYNSRETLLSGATHMSGHDILTCALQLMMTALTIIDTAEVPSEVGAYLDHSLQKLADYLVEQQGRMA